MPGDAVFWNQKRPSRPLLVKAIQKKMARYAKAAGIMASCQSLRHTLASNLLEQGAEIVSIRELLGHASITSSERYAKVSKMCKSATSSPLTRCSPRIFPCYGVRGLRQAVMIGER